MYIIHVQIYSNPYTFYSIAKQRKDGWYEVTGTVPANKSHIITNILFLKGIKVEHNKNVEIDEELYNLLKKYI